ncbi:E3 ubiquitin/ISG15 ligase TRIM25 isoform 1-T1 [Synchiropus picturatus]
MSLSKPVDLLALELSCAICFQLYLDPVALPCGHSYCRACLLQTSATLDGGKTLPRCPECRSEYDGFSTLPKNFKLSNIIEGYLASAPELARLTEEVQEGAAFCDHCIDERALALQACLNCEVTLCSRHLQRHNEKASFRDHILVAPQQELGIKGCQVHQRPLEYFCSSDMAPLCGTCLKEGYHHNHDVLTFSAAEEEMRRALQTHSKVVSGKLQLTEILLKKTVEEQGTCEAVGDKMIDKAVTIMERIAGLVDRYKEKLSTVLEEERGQRRKSWQLGLSVLEEQQQQLQEAQQSTTEVLSVEDPWDFINRFMQIEPKVRGVVSGSFQSNIPSKVPLNTSRLQMDLKTKDFRSEMTLLLDSLCILLNPLELTFDVATAHPSLVVSSDLRSVKYSATKQQHPDHAERFTSAPQVLCSQGILGGEHIWVVEVGAKSMWSVGMCYRSIPRRGDHSRLGHNSVSWRIQWKNNKLTVCQSSCNVALGEIRAPPQRIEVALDYEGGSLSFHSTKGRREHLHTFRAVFREPLYPAFSIHSNTPESWIVLNSGM